MPNLENLRKQAKQLLRWHRDRHYSVAATFRQHLPKLAGLSDEEILAREIKLADAQEAVARRSGFSSWQELTQGASTMTTQSEVVTNAPLLIQAEPQLFTTDIDRSFAFYESIGFTRVFAYGDPPFYGQVERDGVKLNLRLVPTPMDLRRWEAEDLLSASITVHNIKALFLAFQTAGATFANSLHAEPWGARTFTLRDPDANLILFAE